MNNHAQTESNIIGAICGGVALFAVFAVYVLLVA